GSSQAGVFHSPGKCFQASLSTSLGRRAGCAGCGWLEATGCCWAGVLDSQQSSTSRLASVRPWRLRARAVVRRFLRNGDVMRMALLHGRGAHHDESAARPQLLDVPCPTVPHSGPQPADELVDKWREWSLVRNAPLDPLRHQLVRLAVPLAIAILRAGHHGPD